MNKTSSAEHLQAYYKKFSIADLPLHVIGSSTTESNIFVIMEAVNKFPTNDSNIIIANKYHARRRGMIFMNR